jgi:SAM-dependent methyltransferase
MLIASDRENYHQANQVWTPSEQTFSIEPFLPKQVKHLLDIGTGSGILALLMSRHSEKVHAIDINPRAIEFARFNAWFNECANITFETVSCGTFLTETRETFDVITGVFPDLMVGSVRREGPISPETRETFDVITGVFPDLMVGSVRREGPISQVVPDGLGLLKEIYNNLDCLLESGGVSVFWHGIIASKQSIGDFFETQVVQKGNLPNGFEVIALSAIKGGQETGIFLVKRRSTKQPALFSRLSPSLGTRNAAELFKVTKARRWFHSLGPEERQDTLLRILEGVVLGIEHKFEKGRFRGQKYQIGNYRFSPQVFDLLQLIDGARTFSEIVHKFLRNNLGDEVAGGSKDRQRVDQILCELVEKGIVGPVESRREASED